MSFDQSLSIAEEVIRDACRVVKAVGEKELEAHSDNILEDDKSVELIVTYTVKGERKDTPCIIPLKHSLFRVEDGNNAILIISKNDTTTKTALSANPVPGLEKVVVVDKMRKTFDRYMQKRDLIKAYTRFLCDASIIPLMPSILGKKCMVSKKHPTPVSINSKSPEKLRESIQKALSSTSMFVNWGVNSVVKVGKLSFSEQELLENILCVLPVVYRYINAENINRLALKIPNSLCIPFYEKPASKMVIVSNEEEEEEEEDEDEDEEEENEVEEEKKEKEVKKPVKKEKEVKKPAKEEKEAVKPAKKEKASKEQNTKKAEEVEVKPKTVKKEKIAKKEKTVKKEKKSTKCSVCFTLYC